MLIARLPFEEFLNRVRDSGKSLGFTFLVIFIAREADCSDFFEQLEIAWSSIHDLTGEKFLFAVIDANKSSQITNQFKISNKIGSILGRKGLVMCSPQIKLLQNLKSNTDSEELKEKSPQTEFFFKQQETANDGINDYIHKINKYLLSIYKFMKLFVTPQKAANDIINDYIHQTNIGKQWRDKHTLGISEIVKCLKNVEEIDIPCLYFECLLAPSSFKIPIKLLNECQLSIYNFMKSIDEKSGLDLTEMKNKALLKKDNSQHIKKLKWKIEEINRKQRYLKQIRKLADSVKWSNEWLNSQSSIPPEIEKFITNTLQGKTEVSEIYSGISSLRQVLDGRSFSELRSHLNRVAALRNDLDHVPNINRLELEKYSRIKNIEHRIESIQEKDKSLEKEINTKAFLIEKVANDILNDAKLSMKSNKMSTMPENSSSPKFIVNAEVFQNIENTSGGDVVARKYVIEQNLAKAAKEIQELLEELAKNNPSIVESTKKETVLENIEQEIKNNPNIKARLLNALKEGGIKALEQALEAVFKNPLVSIPVATVKGFIEA